jgi:hypothetical protein
MRKLREWLSAYEQWESDPDPANDANHIHRLATLASEAGLPFYGEDGETDTGPAGWRRWAARFKEVTEKLTKSYQPKALPWEQAEPNRSK